MEFEWKMYLIGKRTSKLILFIFKNKNHENRKKQICSYSNACLHTYR